MEFAQNLLSTRRGAVLVGAGAAILAALLLVIYLQRYRDSLRSSSAPTTVLVAKSLIPKGTPGDVIGANGQVQIAQLPKDQLKDGALIDPSAIRGRVALDDIYPGQQITASSFSLVPTTALQNKLEGTQRAVAVTTDAVRGLTGDIAAGDRIDVWAELTQQSAGGGQTILRLLLSGVYVLRAPLGGGGNFVLRASQRDAARLAWAYDNAKLYFMLRPPTGARTEPPRSITQATVLFGTGR